MNIKILFNKRSLLASVLFFAGVFMVHAATTPNIAFPIPELGNCTDQASCRAYCDIAENQQACMDFAQSHGLGDASQKRDEIKNAVSDGGPGNCAQGSIDPQISCRAYCSAQEHMQECVAYGKDHGLLKGDALSEAEKVLKALNSGATLPAGCTDQDSCKKICEDPKDVVTAKQCFDFADKAGLLPPGVDRSKAEKTFQLIQEGKAPFKSLKDFKQCEDPSSADILQKCITFGQDNGLISPEDAKIIQETGGKGPGGCVGKDQCQTYCQDHQDECFQFAQDHNLIKPEDKAKIEKGVEMIKRGLENAPGAVKQCIDNAIGSDTLIQVLSGSQLPSPEIGNAIQQCFRSVFENQQRPDIQGSMNGSSTMPFIRDGENRTGSSTVPFFGGQSFDKGFQGQGENAMQGHPQFTQAVRDCIVAKIGQDGLNNAENATSTPDQTTGQVISSCFKESEGERAGPGGCKTAEECKQFCSDPVNASVCGLQQRQDNGNSTSTMMQLRPDAAGFARPPQGMYPQNIQGDNKDGEGDYKGLMMPRDGRVPSGVIDPNREVMPVGSQSQDGQPKYNRPPQSAPIGSTPPTSFIQYLSHLTASVISIFSHR